MPLILAIEPDPRQAAQLATIVHQRLGAELIVAQTTERALGAIGNRVPDLVLVPALLSPQDDAALAAALRVIATAAHVQMLTIPVLGSERPRRIKARGMFSALRGERRSTTSPDGCDPGVFAEQIASYLERAAEDRAADRANVQRPADEPVIETAHRAAPEPDIRLEFLAAEPAIGEQPLSVHDEQPLPIVEEQPQPAIFDSQGTPGTQIEGQPAGLEDTPAAGVEKPRAPVVHESPGAVEADAHPILVEQPADVALDAPPAIAIGETTATAADERPVVFEDLRGLAVDDPAPAERSFAALVDRPPAIAVGETRTIAARFLPAGDAPGEPPLVEVRVSHRRGEIEGGPEGAPWPIRPYDPAPQAEWLKVVR